MKPSIDPQYPRSYAEYVTETPPWSSRVRSVHVGEEKIPLPSGFHLLKDVVISASHTKNVTTSIAHVLAVFSVVTTALGVSLLILGYDLLGPSLATVPAIAVATSCLYIPVYIGVIGFFLLEGFMSFRGGSLKWNDKIVTYRIGSITPDDPYPLTRENAPEFDSKFSMLVNTALSDVNEGQEMRYHMTGFMEYLEEVPEEQCDDVLLGEMLTDILMIIDRVQEKNHGDIDTPESPSELSPR